MKFSKLTIRNFRSVDQTGLDLHFLESDNLAVIVGANGSGKSNLVDALGIVLGVYPFSRFDVDECDFHNRNTDQELVIELHLFYPLVERDVYQQKYEIHGFRFRAWRKQRGDGKGILAKEHYCFGVDGKTIVKASRIYKKASEKDPDPENTMRPVLVQDHAWKIGNAFYLDAPGLETFFGKTTGYGPLGRLFELYRDDFEAEHNVYPAGEKNQTARVAFQKCSGELISILRTEKLKHIEAKLSSHVMDYLGLKGGSPLSVALALPTYQELFDKVVGLRVAERTGGPPLPVERLGSGHRALLRLAAIETLLEVQQLSQSLLLIIEEPEIYLHVHLQRYFSDVLQRVAEFGHQIVFTTHSTEFVDLGRPREIMRIGKNAKGITSSKQVPTKTTFAFENMGRKLRRIGNEEIFFASHAFLTEGQDDQGVFELLFQKKGIDINVHSISIVGCDSANNLPDYIELCAHLGIDFYAVQDEDDPKTNEVRNKKIVAAAKGAGQLAPSLHKYVPFLEATVGETKHCGLEKLFAKLKDKSYADVAKCFPDLVKPLDQFAASRGF